MKRVICTVIVIFGWSTSAMAQAQNDDGLIKALEGALERLNAYERRIEDLEAQPEGVPVGAVIAFDRPNGCPRGWSEFEDARGRTVLGANAERTHGYTARKFREIGGEEDVALTVEEMPNHKHSIQTPYIHGPGTVFGAVKGKPRAPYFQGQTLLSDGGQPHNNMPPYIALYFCKKGKLRHDDRQIE